MSPIRKPSVLLDDAGDAWLDFWDGVSSFITRHSEGLLITLFVSVVLGCCIGIPLAVGVDDGPTAAQAANRACHGHGGVRQLSGDKETVVCLDGIVKGTGY